MTTMELNARKMDLVEAVILSDSSARTYDMPPALLNALLDRAEENKKTENVLKKIKWTILK